MSTQPPAPILALVVDDEPLLRMSTVDLLADEGFVVLEAGDAAAALVVLQNNPTIRLLMTDVHMPGAVDGFGLARIVGTRWPAISTVVVSGVANPKPGDLPDGARFIAKPFSAELALATIRALDPH